MRRALIVSAFLLTVLGATTASATHVVRYVSKHPIPRKVGHGFCYITVPHVHDYEPSDPRLYRQMDGQYYFVGDPAPFEYDGPRYSYYGAHPIADVDVHFGAPTYCYLRGPHYHWYAPPPQTQFEMQRRRLLVRRQLRSRLLQRAPALRRDQRCLRAGRLHAAGGRRRGRAARVPRRDRRGGSGHGRARRRRRARGVGGRLRRGAAAAGRPGRRRRRHRRSRWWAAPDRSTSIVITTTVATTAGTRTAAAGRRRSTAGEARRTAAERAGAVALAPGGGSAAPERSAARAARRRRRRRAGAGGAGWRGSPAPGSARAAQVHRVARTEKRLMVAIAAGRRSRDRGRRRSRRLQQERRRAPAAVPARGRAGGPARRRNAARRRGDQGVAGRRPQPRRVRADHAGSVRRGLLRAGARADDRRAGLRVPRSGFAQPRARRS